MLGGCGSDDASITPPSDGADASGDESRNADASRTDDGSSLPPDATLTDASVDASFPPLPPAFQQCGTCMQMTCAPEIAACEADPYCTQLIECSITSGCLQSDPSSCVPSCAQSLGLTQKETLQEVKLLQSIATTCASCLAECPHPDGGDGG